MQFRENSHIRNLLARLFRYTGLAAGSRADTSSPNQALIWSKATGVERDHVISSRVISAASRLVPDSNSITCTVSPALTRQLKAPAANCTLAGYSYSRR